MQPPLPPPPQMYPVQQWGQPPPPPPPQPSSDHLVSVSNPYLQQQQQHQQPGFAPPGPTTTIYLAPPPPGSISNIFATSIDHAFAKSGRDLSISTGAFSLITFCVAAAACASPWVLFPTTSNGAGTGAFLAFQDCSLAIGLLYYGLYGPNCPAALASIPRYGTQTLGAACASRGFCVNAVTGQVALVFLALACILSAIACASSFLACGRYYRASNAAVAPQHFGTAMVMVGLSAAAFTLASIGVILASLWIGPLPVDWIDGVGRLAGDAAIGCGLIAMVLAIVLKFKTRALGKTSAPENGAG